MITPEQREAFVTAYHANPSDLPGACAAADVPAAFGKRMLTDGRVSFMLAKRRTRAIEGADISAAAILRRLAAIAFADPRELVQVVTNEEGESHVLVNDTSEYGPEATALYAGAKQTKDGVEVKTHDQMAALRILAAYAGITTDAGKVEFGASPELRRIVRVIVKPGAEGAD